MERPDFQESPPPSSPLAPHQSFYFGFSPLCSRVSTHIPNPFFMHELRACAVRGHY